MILLFVIGVLFSFRLITVLWICKFVFAGWVV